jgi:hypothetical protein
MPRWIDLYAARQAKKAGLKPGTKSYNADKYTIIRKMTHKEKTKKS